MAWKGYDCRGMSDLIEAILVYILQAHSSENEALFVVLVACVVSIWSLRSEQSRQSSSSSIWLCLAFGALCSLNHGLLRWTFFGLSIGCALLHWSLRRGVNSSPSLARTPLALLSILALGVITFLLFYRLVPNFEIPLVWEGAVILSFLQEVTNLKISDAFFVRLLWTEGLLSEGDYSLLYGFPTALLLSLHSSLLSLRIVSVICFLAAATLIGVFGKRYATASVGVASCVVFGLNELGLVFGRYGSSIAATLLSIVVALICCANAVARPTWYRIAFAGLALYVATLGYAPGRLIVLVLIVMTLYGLYSNKGISRLRLLSLSALLCFGVVAVFLIQHRFHRSEVYASARHEQFFKLFGSGLWPDRLLPKWRAFQKESRQPQLADYLDFGRELLVTTTLPQLRDLTLPFERAPNLRREFIADPLYLELYSPYLFPFLIIGFLRSRSYLSTWNTQTLTVWALASFIPILFTNRVDSYRTCMALIPFSVWIAIGFTETLNEIRKAQFPAFATPFVICAALTGITASRVNALSFPNTTSTKTDLLIESLEPRFISKSIIAVEAQEFRASAQTQLLLLGRQQRGLPLPKEVISAGKYRALLSRDPSDVELRERTLKEMVNILETGAAVILAPHVAMAATIQRLESKGYKAYPAPVLGDSVVVVLK